MMNRGTDNEECLPGFRPEVTHMKENSDEVTVFDGALIVDNLSKFPEE
jgi:hypothetical protein